MRISDWSADVCSSDLLDQLMEQPFVAANYRAVEGRFPGAPRDRLLRELVRDQIGVMVNDVIAATAANVENAAVTSADEVRAAGRTLGGFSPELAGEERELDRKSTHLNSSH